MSELVENLRRLDQFGLFDGGGHALWAEAADEIERLSASAKEAINAEWRRIVVALGNQRREGSISYREYMAAVAAAAEVCDGLYGAMSPGAETTRGDAKPDPKTLGELCEAMERAPEPYEYMSKADFKALPSSMRSFVDAHRNWLNTARAALAKARGDA